MERRVSKPHTRGLSNNPIIKFLVLTPTALKFILIFSSHLGLGFPKGLFPVGLPFRDLKESPPYSILATCTAFLNLLDLITLLGEQSMKFIIVEPSTFLILISFGPNYSLQ